MKLFFKYVGEYMRLYPQVRVTRTNQVLIQNSVMKHLGLTNLNHMRDRYEGQAFFDKTMKNVGGLYSLQKYLKLETIDFDLINLDNFHPSIKFGKENININVFDFGTLPLLNRKDFNKPTYFIIKKDSLTFLLCGLASKEVIKKNLIDTSKVQSGSDNFMNFTGFKFLEQII
jgi:hypothetical protein